VAYQYHALRKLGTRKGLEIVFEFIASTAKVQMSSQCCITSKPLFYIEELNYTDNMSEICQVQN